MVTSSQDCSDVCVVHYLELRWILKTAESMSRKSMLRLSNQNRPKLSSSKTSSIHIYEHPGITYSTNKNITLIPQIIPYVILHSLGLLPCIYFCNSFAFICKFINLTRLIGREFSYISLGNLFLKAITPVLFLFTTFTSPSSDPTSMGLSLFGQH